MIRSLVAIAALLIGTQVCAEDSTTESEHPTTTYATQPTTPQTTDSPDGCPPMDANDEVLLPPLLEENSTKVIFDHGNEYMQVRFYISKQYSTLKVDFEDAFNGDAGIDVSLESPSTLTHPYWTFDDTTDPCNVIVTSMIPWNEFRRIYGGVHEKRTPHSVWYKTLINVETTFEFELKPNTLLAEGDNPHHIQKHRRIVRNVIPFSIHFDLKLDLWAKIDVPSPMLRKASALLETSVLSVAPEQNPMAYAILEFVTIIPSPIYLDAATISVSDPALEIGLDIQEILSKRDCDNVNVEGFCTQHWRVHVFPKKCDLNAIYTATMHGACNPESNNCNAPNPDTMDIELTVTSDDYCGVSQTVELEGTLHLKPTECNKYMKGSVIAYSPQGAKLSQVEILKLWVHPTLIGQQFLTVFDNEASPPISILNFRTEHPTGNQVDFEFLWRGKQLRCDVTAQVDVTVRVEYEATQPVLLAAPTIQVTRQKMAIGSSGKATLLDVEDMQLFGGVRVAADPNPETTVAETLPGGNAGAKRSSASVVAAASASIAAVAIVATLNALL